MGVVRATGSSLLGCCDFEGVEVAAGEEAGECCRSDSGVCCSWVCGDCWSGV